LDLLESDPHDSLQMVKGQVVGLLSYENSSSTKMWSQDADASLRNSEGKVKKILNTWKRGILQEKTLERKQDRKAAGCFRRLFLFGIFNCRTAFNLACYRKNL